MDRLSRFYRAKMEGDLPVAISPPLEFQRQDEEGTLRMPSACEGTHGVNASTCGTCKCNPDLDWILELSTDTISNNDTIPAVVHALQPTSPKEGVIGRPFHREAGQTPTERNAPETSPRNVHTAREDEGRISQRISGEEKANREKGRSQTAHVFLDSGCLTGSYITEELARKLASTKSIFFTPHVTRVCGAFGGCELSTRTLNVVIELANCN